MDSRGGTNVSTMQRDNLLRLSCKVCALGQNWFWTSWYPGSGLGLGGVINLILRVATMVGDPSECTSSKI